METLSTATPLVRYQFERLEEVICIHAHLLAPPRMCAATVTVEKLQLQPPVCPIGATNRCAVEA